MHLTYEHDPSGIVIVYAHNGVLLGVLLKGDDGYYDFWPEQRGGFWPAWVMREIADKVDGMNEEWHNVVAQEIGALK